MWAYVSGVVDQALAKFSTTIEEDAAILERDNENNTLGFNKRNCVLYRKGEKAVLHFFKECASSFKLLLTLPTPEKARAFL